MKLTRIRAVQLLAFIQKKNIANIEKKRSDAKLKINKKEIFAATANTHQDLKHLQERFR